MGHASEAVADQWRAFAQALAVTLGPVWVSDPSNISAAEQNARQLSEASCVGLSVPDTLWTNDLDEARAR